MSEFLNNTAQDSDALTIYMGDSPPDLLCLLEAGVGIEVGRNKELYSENLREVGLIGGRGVARGKCLAGGGQPRLFRVGGFKEIVWWLEGK